MTEKMQWKLLSAYEGFICDANLPKEIDKRYMQIKDESYIGPEKLASNKLYGLCEKKVEKWFLRTN